jgi:hypothetical protein
MSVVRDRYNPVIGNSERCGEGQIADRNRLWCDDASRAKLRHRMRWPHWTIAALAVLLGAWLLFDGIRALTAGDFATATGESHAGRLGPWASLLRGLGIDPRHPAVKLAHVLLGLCWFAACLGVVVRAPWARIAVIGVGVASLWYLPFGTVLGAAAIAIAAGYLP